MAFSPDGRRIVSGGVDGTVRVWDATTGEPIGAPLSGHATTVASVAFSPDGRHIVSGSADKTLRVWDAGTGQQVGPPLAGHTHTVKSVAFSPDGTRIASASEDPTVRLWPGPPAWPDLLCDKLTSNMSHQQWNEWVSPAIDYIKACPDLPAPRTSFRPSGKQVAGLAGVAVPCLEIDHIQDSRGPGTRHVIPPGDGVSIVCLDSSCAALAGRGSWC